MARVVNNCAPACGPAPVLPLAVPPCPPCSVSGPQGLVVNFVYDPDTATLSGTATFNGEPYAEQTLSAFITEGDVTEPFPIETDANGNFSFPGISPSATDDAIIEVRDEDGNVVGSIIIPANSDVPSVLRSSGRTEEGTLFHGTGNRADGFALATQDGIQLGVSFRYPHPEVSHAETVPQQTGAYNVNTIGGNPPTDWRFAFSFDTGATPLADFDIVRLSFKSNISDPDSVNALIWDYDVESNTFIGSPDSTNGDGESVTPDDIVDSSVNNPTAPSVVQNIQSGSFEFIRDHLRPAPAGDVALGSFKITLEVIPVTGQTEGAVILEVPFSVSTAL